MRHVCVCAVVSVQCPTPTVVNLAFFLLDLEFIGVNFQYSMVFLAYFL